MNAPAPVWQLLFAPEATAAALVPVTMRLLTKRGHPLLLLPHTPHLAIRGLELYPAQTTRGRLARLLAGWALQARLPLGIKSVRVNLSPDDSFTRWLASLASIAPGILPLFAVLAGNPNSPGQRFILLLFDPAGQPVAVVKAGVSAAAWILIEQEQRFLESIQPSTPGIPPLRGIFGNPNVQAMALNFLPGRSPQAKDEHHLPQVLGNWLRPQQRVVFTDTRIWRELSASSAEHAIYRSLTVAVRHQSSAGAIVHGDFAPWNVRVSPSGTWMVLDWERGDLNGLPAWDWFHYPIQKSILVQRQPVTALVAITEALLAENTFKAYAEAAGIIGHERSLMLLYLLYQAEVIRPAEGLATTRELLNQLVARWR